MIPKPEDENLDNEGYAKTLLSKAEISILLDNYDDIFSSFDPRPYAYRALSDDFLVEAKNAALEKEGALDLSFMIPKVHRNFEHEVMIKRRLREHFKKHASILENEIKKIRRKGFLMALAGVFMIIFATYLFSMSSDNILIHFMIVILEPAGWFTAWTGLDELYYTTRQRKPDFEFYHKMIHAGISFHTY